MFMLEKNQPKNKFILMQLLVVVGIFLFCFWIQAICNLKKYASFQIINIILYICELLLLFVYIYLFILTFAKSLVVGFIIMGFLQRLTELAFRINWPQLIIWWECKFWNHYCESSYNRIIGRRDCGRQQKCCKK